MKTLRCLAAAAVALSFAACGSTTDSANPPVTTNTPPAVRFTALKAYDGLRELASIEVTAEDAEGLASVELLRDGNSVRQHAADGAKSVTFKFNFDTADIPDGIGTLRVRAIDGGGLQADSPEVPVVFYNGGQLVLEEEGRVSIPGDYVSGDLDLKHHWSNPEGIGRIIGALRWDAGGLAEPWKFEFAVGSGECPDNGEVLSEQVTGDAGSIVAIATPTGGQVKTGMHFAHLRPLEAAKHKGQELPYSVVTYVFAQ